MSFRQLINKALISSLLLITLPIAQGCVTFKKNLPVSEAVQDDLESTLVQPQVNLDEAALVFDSVQFEVDGPSFAWPAADISGIYVGSGFKTDCQGIGQVRKFDAHSLNKLWKADIVGAIGDTRLLIADTKVMVAAGERIYALDTRNGKTAWKTDKFSGHCFQESMGRLSEDKKTYFIGSSKGSVAAINVNNGEVLWTADMPGAVFGMPLVVDAQVIWADMSGQVSSFKKTTGELLWSQRFGDSLAFFAGPVLHRDKILVVSRNASQVIISDLKGKELYSHKLDNSFIAMPVSCNGSIALADMKGSVSWLSNDLSKTISTVKIADGYIFGTPLCIEDQLILSVYDRPSNQEEEKIKSSSLLVNFRDSNEFNSYELPCCLHALPSMIYNDQYVYIPLTLYSSEKKSFARLLKVPLSEVVSTEVF